MRVNHAGEVAAQGLYHGQALVARDPAIRALLERAGREEADHLAWCEHAPEGTGQPAEPAQPVWYAGSFAIGVVAGLASDPVSLGFVAETERQVERHLDSHLEQLPSGGPAQPGHPRAPCATMSRRMVTWPRSQAQSTLPAPIRQTDARDCKSDDDDGTLDLISGHL